MKKHRGVAVFLLLVGLLAFPIALLGVFGLAGSDPKNFILMYVGYFFYLLGAALGIWRKKFLFSCLAGILIFSLGIILDYQFWKDSNQNLCTGLRTDTYCVESATVFECVEPSRYGNMVTPSSFCIKNLTEEERDQSNKEKRTIQLEQSRKTGTPPIKKIPDHDKTTKAFDSFKSIARTIISSSNPETLDFENGLVSVYHCLLEEYDHPVKGEIMTSNILKRLIKNDEEKERYARYSAAHGRRLNSNHFVAALPAGPPDLNCKTLSNISTIKR